MARDIRDRRSHTMDDYPRQKLRELVAKYGPSIVDDTGKCKGFLLDYCGKWTKEINLLHTVLTAGIVQKLQSPQSQMPVKGVIARHTETLIDQYGLSEEAARWAVESWLLALGMASEEDFFDTKETTPSPAVSGESRVRQKGTEKRGRVSETELAKTSDVQPPLKHKNVKKVEDYGLNKKLSVWNVQKIESPELYGGLRRRIYNWLTILSFLLSILFPLPLIGYGIIVGKGKCAIRKYQARRFALWSAIGFILWIGLCVLAGEDGQKSDVKQIRQVKAEETKKIAMSRAVEGVYDGTWIGKESGDLGGSIITITKTESGYTAKWEDFEGPAEPVDTASNLPVTVSGDTVSIFIGGAVWRGIVNDTGLVAADGTVYKRAYR